MATDWARRHTDYHQIQEVARGVMRENNIDRNDMEESLFHDPQKEVFLRLQRLILEAQDKYERELLQEHEDCSFISDRGPDPIVFALVYASHEAAAALAESKAGQACLSRYRRCLVVLVCPLLSVTDDNFRFVQESKHQELFTQRMSEILDKYQVPYIYLDEINHQKRMSILERAVNGELPINTSKLGGASSRLCLVFNTKDKIPPKNVVVIRTLEITLDTVKCTYTRSTANHTNRMADRYGADQLLLVAFDYQVLAQTVQNILLEGVVVDDEEFQFLGCSSSGLKARKCYMMKGSVEDVERVLAECGNFKAITSVSKRLKRIGLLFSEALPTKVEMMEKEVHMEDDIETKAGNFTDGCGSISRSLAQSIIWGVRDGDQDSYLPSVYQIRYDGCKGVVSIDPSLKGPKLMVRKSMKKFKSGLRPFTSLWLCAHSRPYRYGKLNRQFIMLLSGLGVEDDVFLEKQRILFTMIKSMTVDPEIATQMLFWDDQPEAARSVAKCPTPEAFLDNAHLQKIVAELQNRYISKVEKLSLFVRDSRTVFGVCDQLNALEYGQCFIRPTIRGTPSSIVGKVIVAKSPSYLLGDIRVLEAVDIPQLHHLVDCIVFPTRGKQPHPNEIAGSDLDGDEYFVCWDAALLPPTLREPYDYPPTEGRDTSVANRKSMIAYVSKQNKQSAIMGRIDSCYQYFANLYGVECSECDQLGRLFSRSVDSTKTGDAVRIPKRLQPPSDPQERRRPDILPVWMKMRQIAEEKKDKFVKKLISGDGNCLAISEDLVWALVEDRALGVDEFELFQFIRQWCHTHYSSDNEATDKLIQFSEYINFGKMRLNEKVAAMDVGVPKSLVTNALNCSSLLSPDMLEEFSLHAPHCGWSFYFRAESSNFDWQHLVRALRDHPESLIVLHLGDGMTVGIHFLAPVPLGLSNVLPGSVAVYFFSFHFGYKLRHILGSKYNLNLNDELFQLYRNQDIGQTFIWLRSEQFSKSDRHQCEEIMFNRISVDLTQFQRDILRVGRHPTINKHHFQEMEVFVKSASTLELAYFDLYLTEEPLDWSPVLITHDELEELVMTNEDTHTTQRELPAQFDSTAESLEFLKRAASAGDVCQYLKVMQMVLTQCSELPSNMGALLQELLVQVVVGNTHGGLDQNRLDTLQTLTASVIPHVSNSVTCLTILSQLSRLHCPELLQQVVTPLLSGIVLKEVDEFVNVCSMWEHWYFLPTHVAHSLPTRLHTLCQSLLPEHQTQPDRKAIGETVIKMATDRDTQEPIDNTQACNYASHFTFLLLCHLIDEFDNRRDQISSKDNDTSYSVVRLKVYDTKDPHHPTGDKGKTWRVEFSRSQGITAGCFTAGTSVAVNMMTKDGEGVVRSIPVALGTLVHVTKNPANMVVDVKKPVPRCLVQSAQMGRGHWELCSVGNITAFKRAAKALRGISGNCSNEGVLPLLVHSFSSTSDHSDSLGLPPASPVTRTDTVSLESAQREDITIDVLVPNSKKQKLFNASQQAAITAALTQRLTLIHGPPGTGKTSVACEIVCRVLKQLERKDGNKEYVLVTAETNMAVDNLTRHLLHRDIDVLRVGNKALVAPDLHHLTLDQHPMATGGTMIQLLH